MCGEAQRSMAVGNAQGRTRAWSCCELLPSWLCMRRLGCSAPGAAAGAFCPPAAALPIADVPPRVLPAPAPGTEAKPKEAKA